MPDTNVNTLIAGVGRDMVMKLAPQELPLFRANSEAFFKDPQRALRGRTGKDEMLGFGATDTDTAAKFLTPAVLAVTQAVVDFITNNLAQTNSAQAKSLFKKFRAAEGSQASALTLTTEQLAQVRQLALDQGRAVKLSDEQTHALADAIISSLATSS